MAKRLLALGADGIPKRWVVVGCFSASSKAGGLPPVKSRRTELRVCDTVADIAALRKGAGSPTVGLDVPVGLLAHGGSRPCDYEAKKLLGKSWQSVFSPPARYLFPALSEATSRERWKRVQQLVAEHQNAFPDEHTPGVTQQTVGILDKVRDADEFMAEHAHANTWLFEVHPEVSFLRMNGGKALPGNKRSASGLLRRLELVSDEFPDAPDVIRGWEHAADVDVIDILDAYAVTWSALRQATSPSRTEHLLVGEELDKAPLDGKGIPMRMAA